MELYIAPNGDDKARGTLDTPLKTLSAAVRRMAAAEDGYWDGRAEIILRGGVYPVDRTIDIATNMPLTIRACTGEEAVLDGGRVIENLTEGELHGLRCWTAELPDVREGKWFFHSLFASGERCTRAYLPREGYYWIESTRDPEWTMNGGLFDGEYGFIAREGDIKNFRNLTDAEVHVFHYWTDEHMPIASFDPETREVRSERRSIFVLKDDQKKRFAKYRVEHIFEGLCEPGDFYLDRAEGKLYYLPREDETLENTVLTAPVVETIINVHDASDVRLENLTLRHTDWSLPERLGRPFSQHDDGTLYASAPQAATNIPGAISFENCKRCAVIGCEISHVGTYAVDMVYACHSMQVEKCRMLDLGAGGVKLNGATAQDPASERTHHVVIADNDIGFGGRVFLAGVGVASLRASHIDIVHNHIHDLYYSGVSCGWLWGYEESTSFDNTIAYNHIHCLGHGVLSDMGGIYTLSVQPGTVIHHNLVYDIEKANYGGWAIYPDEGSSHILIENNVCFGTSSSCFHQHYGRENIVRNNIWAFGREGIVAFTRPEEHIGFTFERNILLTKGEPVYTGKGIEKIKADMNLFWDVEKKPLSYAPDLFKPEENESMDQLKARGYDLFSVVADPKFADPEHGDFTLAPDSPAFDIGFVPIDLSTVGPRVGSAD